MVRFLVKRLCLDGTCCDGEWPPLVLAYQAYMWLVDSVWMVHVVMVSGPLLYWLTRLICGWLIVFGWCML